MNMPETIDFVKLLKPKRVLLDAETQVDLPGIEKEVCKSSQPIDIDIGQRFISGIMTEDVSYNLTANCRIALCLEYAFSLEGEDMRVTGFEAETDSPINTRTIEELSH